MSGGCDASSGLPEIVQEKAKEELGEKIECRKEDIQKLREIVNSYPDLRCDQDEAFLLMFLRARKFNHQDAAKLIRRYDETRVKYSKFFSEYRPSAVRDFYKAGMYVMLPIATDTDPQPILFRPGRWDPSSFSEDTAWRANTMQAEMVRWVDERCQVNGFVIITDLGDLSWTQAKYMRPHLARFLTDLLQNSMPSRMKGIHMVNGPRIFDYLFAMVRQLLNKKLRKRVHVHSSPTYLQDHFDLSTLPSSLGGTLDIEPIISKWEQIMADSEERIVSWGRYGIIDKDSRSEKGEVTI